MDTILAKALYKTHLISPLGLLRLSASFLKEGVTLMAILRFSAQYYPNECALVSEGNRLTYGELYGKTKKLAMILYHQYGLSAGMKTGVLCRNHETSALTLPALSRLGVNIRLLNTDMVSDKIGELINNGKIDHLIYDEELREKCLPDNIPCATITTEELSVSLSEESVVGNKKIPHQFKGAQISVLTGGSSGVYKEASRQTGLFQFLPPFFALLRDIKIHDYKSVYVALPFYHGFGLGVLIIAWAMGKKICLSRHFKAIEAIKTIHEEEVEVLPIVPAMLARIWQIEGAKEMAKSVKCVISGGDRLDKKIYDETQNKLGDVLFNLYGTTEAGFFMMATPECLAQNEEMALGKPIKGVKCEIREEGTDGVGELWVRSEWAMIGSQGKWQATGDLAYRNPSGVYFHRGISRNMVVCGGENVYPENVERILNSHPDIVATKVYPASDPEFGTVLNAQIELREGVKLTETELKNWAYGKLSRAEMPHRFTFKALEILSTGKRRAQ